MRSKWLLPLSMLLFLPLSAFPPLGCGELAPATVMAAVPEVAGMSAQEAGDLLREAGLDTGAVKEAFHDTVPQGMIVSTMPPAGEELEAGSAVELTVSRGPEMVPVPALLGAAEAEALAALQSAGFQAEVVRAYSESVGTGLVSAAEPASGTPVARGKRVTLTVSLGSAYVACGACGGDGEITTTSTCPYCGGTGVCDT